MSVDPAGGLLSSVSKDDRGPRCLPPSEESLAQLEISGAIVGDMPNDHTPLYVRLSADPSSRLERAVALSGKTKRQLVDEALLDQFSDEGFVVGRVALREEAPEVMTLGEAAALLRLESPALEQAARVGEVPARKIAGCWRFSKTALLAWLDNVERVLDDTR
jgi:hypothetical protein